MDSIISSTHGCSDTRGYKPFDEKDLYILQQKLLKSSIQPLILPDILYQLSTFINHGTNSNVNTWKIFNWKGISENIPHTWKTVVNYLEKLYIFNTKDDCFVALWYDQYLESNKLKNDKVLYYMYMKNHVLSSHYDFTKGYNKDRKIILIRVQRYKRHDWLSRDQDIL